MPKKLAPAFLRVAREQAGVDRKAVEGRDFEAHVMVAVAFGRQIPLHVGSVRVRVTTVVGDLQPATVVQAARGREENDGQAGGSVGHTLDIEGAASA